MMKKYRFKISIFKTIKDETKACTLGWDVVVIMFVHNDLLVTSLADAPVELFPHSEVYMRHPVGLCRTETET